MGFRWTEEHRKLRDEADRKIDESRDRLGAERVAYLLERRRVGDMNNDMSAAPGITIYLRDYEVEKNGTQPEQLGRIAQQADRPELAALEPAEGMVSGCYKLEFPTGAYSAGMGGFNIYSHATEEGIRTWSGLDLAFSTGYPFVVRIEGHSGELWQNWGYNPDGSPVERE
jgi:hypothetical protein